jgi:hypothetical protein
MDLPCKKIEKWTIETAQMKHTSRKYSMSTVVQSYLRKKSAEYGIEDYQGFLKSVRDNPESYETLSEKEREFYDMSSGAGAWASVAGCIKPYIQLDEWFILGDALIEKLSTAANEINPHWFEQPEQEKKTDEPQPTSISESVN